MERCSNMPGSHSQTWESGFTQDLLDTKPASLPLSPPYSELSGRVRAPRSTPQSRGTGRPLLSGVGPSQSSKPALENPSWGLTGPSRV